MKHYYYKAKSGWVNFFRSDLSFSIFFGVLLITVFVILPVASQYRWLIKSFNLFISLNFVAGIFIVTKSRILRYLGLVFVFGIYFISLGEIQLIFNTIRFLELFIYMLFFFISDCGFFNKGFRQQRSKFSPHSWFHCCLHSYSTCFFYFL